MEGRGGVWTAWMYTLIQKNPRNLPWYSNSSHLRWCWEAPVALKCLAQTSQNVSWGPKRWVAILQKYLEPLLFETDSRASVLGTLMRFDIWALLRCLAVVLMAHWFCAKIRLISCSANFSTSTLTVKPLSLSLEMITYTVALPAVMWRFVAKPQPWDCQKDLARPHWKALCKIQKGALFPHWQDRLFPRKERSIIKDVFPPQQQQFYPLHLDEGMDWAGTGVSWMNLHTVWTPSFTVWQTLWLRKWNHDPKMVRQWHCRPTEQDTALFTTQCTRCCWCCRSLGHKRPQFNGIGALVLKPILAHDGGWSPYPIMSTILKPLSIEWFVCWFESTNLTVTKIALFYLHTKNVFIYIKVKNG